MISKELFVESINAIKKQEEYDHKCTDAFQIILNEDRIIIGYDNSILRTQLIRVLEKLMEDNGEWIQYFIYDLDYGKNYKEGCAIYKDKSPIDLSTAEKLHHFLYREVMIKNIE